MPERVSRRVSVQTERDQEGERNRAERETEETRGEIERERGREGGGTLCGGRGAEASRDSPGKGRCVLPSPHWGFKLASV